MFDLATVKRTAFKTLFTAKTEQPRVHSYVYVNSNDIHNLVTIVLLSQQLSTVLVFSLSLRPQA